jgi:hypothetical protein
VVVVGNTVAKLCDFKVIPVFTDRKLAEDYANGMRRLFPLNYKVKEAKMVIIEEREGCNDED